MYFFKKTNNSIKVNRSSKKGHSTLRGDVHAPHASPRYTTESNVQNCDFFQLVISTVRQQFYLNNVIRTHLVELNGSLTTHYLQKFIVRSLKICSVRKKCPSVFLYYTERSLPCPCEKISSVEYW